MQKAIKRIFDVIFALLVLAVLAPVWIVLAIWIAVTSPGGVFFRQKRTGYKGREFDMLKFRSMYINREADTLQATGNDPRITPVGRFLRRSALECGDRGYVGYRPQAAYAVAYRLLRSPHPRLHASS